MAPTSQAILSESMVDTGAYMRHLVSMGYANLVIIARDWLLYQANFAFYTKFHVYYAI